MRRNNNLIKRQAELFRDDDAKGMEWYEAIERERERTNECAIRIQIYLFGLLAQLYSCYMSHTHRMGDGNDLNNFFLLRNGLIGFLSLSLCGAADAKKPQPLTPIECDL